MNIVGKGIAKIDGMSIATGKPVYTDDLAVICVYWLTSSY